MNPSQSAAVPADFTPLQNHEHSSGAAENRAVLSVFARLSAVVLGVGPIVLLGIALSLSPSKSGLGTHQQLGLPPCSMRVILGIRCPACGMTTSWSHFTRGQWLQSANVNPGGFLLALYCFPFAACCFWAACKGNLPRVRTQNAMILGLLVIAIVSVIQWFAKMSLDAG